MLRRLPFFKAPSGRLTGDTWFMVATFILILCFPRDPAIASLWFLAVGDAGSAIAGTAWGRTPLFRNKTLEGMAGGIVANAAVAAVLSRELSLPAESLAAGVLIAALGEVLPLPVDDNLTVGLLSGAAMTAVARALAAVG